MFLIGVSLGEADGLSWLSRSAACFAGRMERLVASARPPAKSTQWVQPARAALICIDDAAAATRITALPKSEFPLLPVVARARDRIHSLALLRAGPDVQVRETFESAVAFGIHALQQLGADEQDIAESTSASAQATTNDADGTDLWTRCLTSYVPRPPGDYERSGPDGLSKKQEVGRA